MVGGVRVRVAGTPANVCALTLNGMTLLVDSLLFLVHSSGNFTWTTTCRYPAPPPPLTHTNRYERIYHPPYRKSPSAKRRPSASVKVATLNTSFSRCICLSNLISNAQKSTKFAASYHNSPYQHVNLNTLLTCLLGRQPHKSQG